MGYQRLRYLREVLEIKCVIREIMVSLNIAAGAVAQQITGSLIPTTRLVLRHPLNCPLGFFNSPASVSTNAKQAKGPERIKIGSRSIGLGGCARQDASKQMVRF